MIFASRIACWMFLDLVMQATSKLAWLLLGQDQCWACLCWLLRGPWLASLLVLGLGDSGPWWGGLLPLRAPLPPYPWGGGLSNPEPGLIYIYIGLFINILIKSSLDCYWIAYRLVGLPPRPPPVGVGWVVRVVSEWIVKILSTLHLW